MNQNNNPLAHLAPLYTTNYFMPEFQTGEYGDWRISIMGLGHDYGYTTHVWTVQNVPILSRRNNDRWESWMSLTPHEIESQELGAQFGFGHMVIMGLGLGWLAANAALNPQVEKVTVIEIDPKVIELFNSTGSFSGLAEEAKNKINIICADAMQWKSEEKVNFLYADIWKSLNEDCALSDVQKMQDNLNTPVIYFWGQELTIYSAFKKHYAEEQDLNVEIIREIIAQQFNLPLLVPEDRNYADMIDKVVENRKKRGFTVS